MELHDGLGSPHHEVGSHECRIASKSSYADAVRSPERIPLSGFPERVTIYEVGPRDGLQNEREIVDVALKAEFVRRLVAAGLSAVELTSFVLPKWAPQLADA